MNDERCILAELKREIVNRTRKAESFSGEKRIYTEVLLLIAEIEADAVLGEETESELPWAAGEEDA